MPTRRVSPSMPDTGTGSPSAVPAVVNRTSEVPSTRPTMSMESTAPRVAADAAGPPTGGLSAAGSWSVPAHETVATRAAPAIRAFFHDVYTEISRCWGADLSGGHGRELSCVHGAGERADQTTFPRAGRAR